jgi:hypothetical protein
MLGPDEIASWMQVLGPAGAVIALLCLWLKLERTERIDLQKRFDELSQSMYERQEKMTVDMVTTQRSTSDILNAFRTHHK